MPIFVPKIMNQLKKELDGETVELDEDMEEDDDEEGDDQATNVVMPPLDLLVKFIRRYAPTAFPASLDDSALAADMTTSQQALLCRVVGSQVSSTIERNLSSNGIGADLKFRYAVDSLEGKALSVLKDAPARLEAILSRVAAPIGTWTAPTAQVAEPTPFALCVAELASLLVNVDAALKLSAQAAFQFISARECYVVAANVLSRFAETVQAANEGAFAEIKAAHDTLHAVYGDLPVIETSRDAFLNMKALRTPTDEFVVVDLAAVHAAGQRFNAAYETVAAKLLEEATKREKTSGFSTHCISVFSDNELERIISGYKNPKKPIAKKMVGRKTATTNDPMVENADSRVVAIFATQNLCDHESLREAIVKADERARAAAVVDGVEDANIAFVQVNLKHYADAPRFIEMFNIKELPAVRFVHSMSLIDEMSVDGGAVDVVESVFNTVESLFEEDENMMMGEDEMDEGFSLDGFEGFEQ